MSRNRNDRRENETLGPPGEETKTEVVFPGRPPDRLTAEGRRPIDTSGYAGGGTKPIAFGRPGRANDADGGTS